MPVKSATGLRISQEGIIRSIDDAAVALRLLSMGIKPGSEIRLTRKSLRGSTCFFCIDKKHYALRQTEARGIIVDADL